MTEATREMRCPYCSRVMASDDGLLYMCSAYGGADNPDCDVVSAKSQKGHLWMMDYTDHIEEVASISGKAFFVYRCLNCGCYRMIQDQWIEKFLSYVPDSVVSALLTEEPDCIPTEQWTDHDRHSWVDATAKNKRSWFEANAGKSAASLETPVSTPEPFAEKFADDHPILAIVFWSLITIALITGLILLVLWRIGVI